MVHSLMAFGTGGLWGTGIGKGYQKLFYLPEPHTDFIFSVIGEELGLIGVMTVITIVALIQGLNNAFEDQISAIGTDTLFIQKYPWFIASHEEWVSYRNRRNRFATSVRRLPVNPVLC